MSDAGVARAMRTKAKLRDKQMDKGKGLGDRDGDGDGGQISTAADSKSRVPKGQSVVKKWIVLDWGLRPTSQQYDPWKEVHFLFLITNCVLAR